MKTLNGEKKKDDYTLPKHGEVWIKHPHPGMCRMGWSMGALVAVIDTTVNYSWGTEHQLKCGCLEKLADNVDEYERSKYRQKYGPALYPKGSVFLKRKLIDMDFSEVEARVMASMKDKKIKGKFFGLVGPDFKYQGTVTGRITRNYPIQAKSAEEMIENLRRRLINLENKNRTIGVDDEGRPLLNQTREESDLTHIGDILKDIGFKK